MTTDSTKQNSPEGQEKKRTSRPRRRVKPAAADSKTAAQTVQAAASAQTKKTDGSTKTQEQKKTQTPGQTRPRHRQAHAALPADEELVQGRQSKLKIIPLGGLGEIGKNMTAYEYGNDIIVVDCGMGFPDEDMYGIDVVIPDISYLKANISKIRGIVITHGHEDHIGAIPYVISELDVPIYATALTNAIIELKLDERDLLKNTQIFTKKPGDRFRLGCFDIELIHVNHSISDAVALAIHTPIGVVIHTGDYKIDVSPIKGEMMDLTRFGELGKQGVLALLSDSTNVEKPGHTDSERKVGEGFDKLFMGCDKRIIVTTFRLQCGPHTADNQCGGKIQAQGRHNRQKSGKHHESLHRAGVYGHSGRHACGHQSAQATAEEPHMHHLHRLTGREYVGALSHGVLRTPADRHRRRRQSNNLSLCNTRQRKYDKPCY
jgi:hypothetical protein